MSSAGHILDMIRRQRANRAMQTQRRDRYRNTLINASKVKDESTFNVEKFGDLSQEKKNNSRQLARNEMRVQKTRYYVISILVLALISLFVALWLVQQV